MVRTCRTCLAITISAHNVSQQPEVLGVDGAVFVTLNRHNYLSYEGAKRDGPVLRWDKSEQRLVVTSMHRTQYIIT